MKLFLHASAIAAFTAVALTSSHAALPAGAGDPVVDVTNSTVVKLNASNGTVQWSTALANDGALAVDPADLSVYTAIGGHTVGTDGTVYKLNANGTPDQLQ